MCVFIIPQETQHHVFLVMEYCNGGDLADYLSGCYPFCSFVFFPKRFVNILVNCSQGNAQRGYDSQFPEATW